MPIENNSSEAFVVHIRKWVTLTGVNNIIKRLSYQWFCFPYCTRG